MARSSPWLLALTLVCIWSHAIAVPLRGTEPWTHARSLLQTTDGICAIYEGKCTSNLSVTNFPPSIQSTFTAALNEFVGCLDYKSASTCDDNDACDYRLLNTVTSTSLCVPEASPIAPDNVQEVLAISQSYNASCGNTWLEGPVNAECTTAVINFIAVAGCNCDPELQLVNDVQAACAAGTPTTCATTATDNAAALVATFATENGIEWNPPPARTPPPAPGPFPPPTPANPPGKKSETPVGAIVGGVVGCLAVLAVALVVVFCCLKRRNREDAALAPAKQTVYASPTKHAEYNSAYTNDSAGQPYMPAGGAGGAAAQENDRFPYEHGPEYSSAFKNGPHLAQGPPIPAPVNYAGGYSARQNADAVAVVGVAAHEQNGSLKAPSGRSHMISTDSAGSGAGTLAAQSNSADSTQKSSYDMDSVVVPQGMGVYNSLLDNTSEIMEKKQAQAAAMANPEYCDVHAVLDYIEEAMAGDIDGRYVMEAGAVRVSGGQAVVAMVQGKYGGSFAVKFIASHSTYLLESEIYALLMSNDPNGGTFIREVCDHKGDVLANGMRMPSYIVMQRGISMQEWIRNRKPPPLMGIWMLGEICAQVAVLHDQGFVHRDLKPGNILFLQENSSWRIIDFGCTVRDGAEVAPAFTLRFAPPEVAIALERQQTSIVAHPSMDIWAIGVMAFEMITGELIYPFGSSSDDIKAILAGHRPFPHETNPSVWRKMGRLRKVVQLMLSRDPNQRPSVLGISQKLDGMAMATGATTGMYATRTATMRMQ